MALIALLIGVVLIVATIRGTHGQLLSAIRADVPSFAIWGAAIFGVACIGFVPGLKPVSRGLLALLIVVIILTNYRNILGAFQGVAFGSQAQSVAGAREDVQAAQASGDGGALLTSLKTLIGTISAGGSGDYSDLFGPQSSNTGNSAAQAAALANATAADDASFKEAQRSAQAAPRAAASAVFEAIAAPFQAIASAVSQAVATSGGSGPLSLSSGLPNSDRYGPSPVTAADPLGTAGSRAWQQDTFTFEAANLAGLLASGQISKSDPGYQSKLDYLANLTGGVATSTAEMAKLKAMGL